MRNLSPLDALLFSNNPAVTWLDEGGGFVRVVDGPEGSGWFCGACGSPVDAPEDGCDHCGYGQDDTDTEGDAR
jgi:hypothetical protein